MFTLTNDSIKRIRRTILVLCGICIIASFSVSNLSYASSPKTVSKEENFWFVVPEGGHSSARVKLTYREYYTVSGSNAIFNKRSRSVLFQRAGATSLPQYTYGGCTHSNGKKFTSWTKKSIMYGSPWNSGSLYENSTSVSYPRSTYVTGTVNVAVTCSGALTPLATMQVTQRLNVQ